MNYFDDILILQKFGDLVVERNTYPYFINVYTRIKDPVLLDERSYHPNYLMRSAVASSDYSNVETLERLSYDENLHVRLDVLLNPRTPQYVLDFHKFKDYLKHYEQP